MIAPRFRQPRQSLSPDQVADLVRMREQGATWKEIGRTFRKQDHACKTIFTKAIVDKAGEGASAPA